MKRPYPKQPPEPVLPPTLRVKDVAARYGVEVGKVRYWIASGALQAINVAADAGPRKRASWRITEEALAAFEESRQSQPPLKIPRQRRRKAPGVIQFY